MFDHFNLFILHDLTAVLTLYLVFILRSEDNLMTHTEQKHFHFTEHYCFCKLTNMFPQNYLQTYFSTFILQL